MTASTFKTARRVRIPSYCEFATHKISASACPGRSDVARSGYANGPLPEGPFTRAREYHW